jgi:hypothetical protein
MMASLLLEEMRNPLHEQRKYCPVLVGALILECVEFLRQAAAECLNGRAIL